MIDELTRLAIKYGSDKGDYLGFTPIYNQYFQSIKDEKLNILEIGVGGGPSLKMWYEYFPNSQIHAIDVDDKSQHNNLRVKTYICDQSNRKQLKDVMSKIGTVDIIIDDGCHVVSHQQITLGFLFPYMNAGGQYWLEDLHTSDRSVWQGKTLYGYDMSISEKQSTVEVIEKYLEIKTFESPFLDPNENKYLTNNIKECKIFQLQRTHWGDNKLAYFRK